MQTTKIIRLITAIVLLSIAFPFLSFSQPVPTSSFSRPPSLGEASKMPKDLTRLPPARESLFPTVTGGFSVDNDSREQVRDFFNAIYPTSDNVPMLTTADVSNCTPGTNSTSFQQAVLRRINWFRALAGEPAGVIFDPTYNSNAQQMAVIISANKTLNHEPPASYTCYTTNGASVSEGNQALGAAGPDAITGYIWDFGFNNSEVGHRRWILYPPEQVMGTGDVPQAKSLGAANLTYVFDSSINSARPPTRQPYVAWPPEGFVPFQIVYPYWSFALSNADFSTATVSMQSNGAPMTTAIQPLQTGFGENTIVWVPMGLDATSQSAQFPFSGPDTVYGITVTNIHVGASTIGFSYEVTVFDPAVPGTDYVATMISGPAQPFVNTGNAYTCVPLANTNVTGYQWRTSQRSSGDLTDNANNGLANFTTSPPPLYPTVTNAPITGDGNCFHLCHTNPTSQFLQLKELLFPATNTVVSFKSLLGYASTDETARAQVSTDGGATWQDLYVQAGTGGPGETSFTQHSFSLSNYTALPVVLRFDFAFTSGSYFPQIDNYVGWDIQNIVVTNAQQLVNLATNSTDSTNFTFTPAQASNYNLEAAPVLFTQFPLSFGPVKQVTALSNTTPVIVMNQPVLTNNQVLLNFNVANVANITAATFKLLQADSFNTAWITNAAATFATNTPGNSYRFTTTNNAGTRFYRVRTP